MRILIDRIYKDCKEPTKRHLLIRNYTHKVEKFKVLIKEIIMLQIIIALFIGNVHYNKKKKRVYVEVRYI